MRYSRILLAQMIEEAISHLRRHGKGRPWLYVFIGQFGRPEAGDALHEKLLRHIDRDSAAAPSVLVGDESLAVLLQLVLCTTRHERKNKAAE